MVSLKLPSLLRRRPDAPSLKERAAALKATAGRVLHRQKSAMDVPQERGGLPADLMTMLGLLECGDGTVSFCDASGRVLRGTVADWVAFTAARMVEQTRKEIARRLGDPSLDDEGRQVLAHQLRRELRSDAVALLAYRHAEAFTVADAARAVIGAGSGPASTSVYGAGLSPDLVRAVEAHREARQIMLHDPVDDDNRTEAHVARIDMLAQAVRDLPARSLADLRHKVLYLWPGSLEGAGLSEALASTFASFEADVMRLTDESVSAGNADADLIALGQQFDAAHDTWLAAVGAAHEPGERFDAFMAQVKARGGPTLKDIEEAWAIDGVRATSEAEDAAYAEACKIASKMLQQRARTALGLAAQARAMIPSVWTGGNFEADAAMGRDEDVDKEAARALIESCCAAAGVDWRGRPVPAHGDVAVVDAAISGRLRTGA